MFSDRTGWRETGQRKSAARSCRFALEQLENRIAPAVYQVNTFQDTPPVNLVTGTDAAGHVSLRSAVAAANAHPHDDTILLDAGIYQVQNGELDVQGKLQIVGQGPSQTTIETRHLDRLFQSEGGDLELNGLTLGGGSADTLLKGAIHLSNTQFTDSDLGVVVAALFAPREADPIAQSPITTPPARLPDVPDVNHTPALPVHLIGQVGGGSTDQSQDASQDQHQTFWRVDSDTAPEQPAPAPNMLDDLKLSRAPGQDAADQDGIVSRQAISNSLAREIVTPNGQQPMAATTLRVIQELRSARIEARDDVRQAMVLLLLVGFHSLPGMVKGSQSSKGWNRRPHRRQKIHRRHDPPKESRRTRGPPGSGTPRIDISCRILQGRQRCLPCSFLQEDFLRGGTEV